jgi:hypothetical protein
MCANPEPSCASIICFAATSQKLNYQGGIMASLTVVVMGGYLGGFGGKLFAALKRSAATLLIATTRVRQ